MAAAETGPASAGGIASLSRAPSVLGPFTELEAGVLEGGVLVGVVSQAATVGIVSRTLAVPLRRNAVVERFDVVVQATPADETPLATAAQVRKQSDNAGHVTVIADFGMPRTVSIVGAVGSSGIQIVSVTPWLGQAFAEKPIYSAVVKNAPAVVTSAPTILSTDAAASRMIALTAPVGPAGSTPSRAILPEVRTERLMITLIGETDAVKIGRNVWVQLPDLPTDLDLRIDDGPPVWTSPGPVQPNARGFDAAAKQTVSLGPALARLTGDPRDETTQTFQIVLTSRVPGRLNVEKAPAGVAISYLTRIDLGPAGERELTFESEGLQEVPLALPAWLAEVERVSLTLTASLPRERVIPPVGPAVATRAGAPLAELVLDVDHAASVRLPRDSGLAELTGVRLPLRADRGGAEARVVLLGAPGDGHEPGPPIDGATSRPVTLDATPDAAGDTWTTFGFTRPVTIDPSAPPWAAVVLSRGKVAWRLGQFDAADDVTSVRRGPPAGPWRALPALISSDPTIGGRVRVVGLAPKDQAKPPLLVNVRGAGGAAQREMAATPTAKGFRLEWPPSADSTAARAMVTPLVRRRPRNVRLQVISHVPGTVTIRDVEVMGTHVEVMGTQ